MVYPTGTCAKCGQGINGKELPGLGFASEPRTRKPNTLGNHSEDYEGKVVWFCEPCIVRVLLGAHVPTVMSQIIKDKVV